jgi:hypothetical protein
MLTFWKKLIVAFSLHYNLGYYSILLLQYLTVKNFDLSLLNILSLALQTQAYRSLLVTMHKFFDFWTGLDFLSRWFGGNRFPAINLYKASVSTYQDLLWPKWKVRLFPFGHCPNATWLEQWTCIWVLPKQRGVPVPSPLLEDWEQGEGQRPNS